MHYQKSICCWLCLMIFQSVASEAQISHLFPFQVLHTENAFHDEFGTTIKQYSFLEADQKIYLNDGHIVFVDYHGEFYELEGSSVNDLKALSDSLEVEELTRLDFKPLFQTSEKHPSNFYTGTISTRRAKPITFNSTEEYERLVVPENVPVRLSWFVSNRVKASGKFTISFFNIFDEVIKVFETDTTFIEIDLERIENDSELYLLKVTDKSDYNIYSSQMAIEVDNGPENAAEALQRGYKYERVREYKLARKFYQLATELSDRQVYQNILENFQKRTHEL